MLAKEHGSSIEYAPDEGAACPPRERPNATGVQSFGSARHALIALAWTRHRTLCLQRILLPDHYCHATRLALDSAVADFGVLVERYPSTFGSTVGIASQQSDLVLINAAFGVVPDWSVTGAGMRILDATHAPDLALKPGSDGSFVEFDYLFASLKLLLQVTDGGVLRAIHRHMAVPPTEAGPGPRGWSARARAVAVPQEVIRGGRGCQQDRLLPRRHGSRAPPHPVEPLVRDERCRNVLPQDHRHRGGRRNRTTKCRVRQVQLARCPDPSETLCGAGAPERELRRHAVHRCCNETVFGQEAYRTSNLPGDALADRWCYRGLE